MEVSGQLQAPGLFTPLVPTIQETERWGVEKNLLPLPGIELGLFLFSST
jgi:hypothetical protein